MDEQGQKTIKTKKVGKILIWVGLLLFFFYSYQSIIDWEQVVNPRRQQALIRVLTELAQPNLFESKTRQQVAGRMWETIQIAFLATVISALFAIPFAFLSTQTSSFWKRGFNFLLQPLLAVIRSIHPLLFMFPVVALVGLGSTGGVLAITLFSTAILITEFSDYAQQHTFLSWLTLLKVHFPILAFKRLRVNLVIATIIGFMGGGGIGFLLQQWFNLLDYRDASVALLAIIVSVASLDLLSRAVWLKIQKEK